MRDLAFYNAGCDEPRGARRLVVLSRRLLRRLLRPIFQRQVVILQEICDRLDRLDHDGHATRGRVDQVDRRHDALAAQMQTTVALGWDYVATVRRLAVLEDRVEQLMADRGTARDDARPSIPFPRPDDEEVATDGRDGVVQAKVS